MSSVIFKAQLVSDCSAGLDASGGDGMFRMGWFSVSGKGTSATPNPPSPTDYQYIRGRLTQILCLPKNQDFDVCYRGADGKAIVIDQDEELRKAVSQPVDGLCKVFVCLKGPNMACG
ncbi:uncharacterized protein LOC124153464 [Ischnura elegans]|uniref:uncharacterized protein LOC124153464 n=1 Tax=Ischnura elegans TaxID=197161 RepID=UPI001ED8BA4A|nr:uncharacterized protein LOC124153464 [Ischnura elegans]